MAIKLDRGGVKALMAWPLVEEFFLRLTIATNQINLIPVLQWSCFEQLFNILISNDNKINTNFYSQYHILLCYDDKCPRSLIRFYIVTSIWKLDMTSWAYSTKSVLDFQEWICHTVS